MINFDHEILQGYSCVAKSFLSSTSKSWYRESSSYSCLSIECIKSLKYFNCHDHIC